MQQVNHTPVPSGQAPNHRSVPKPASPWDVPELDALRASIQLGLKYEGNTRDLGEDLRDLKSTLEKHGAFRGKWRPLLEAEFNLTYKTAENYIFYSAAADWASEALDKALERIAKGEGITGNEVDQIIGNAEADDAEADDAGRAGFRQFDRAYRAGDEASQETLLEAIKREFGDRWTIEPKA